MDSVSYGMAYNLSSVFLAYISLHFGKLAPLKSLRNELSAAPVCSVPMYRQLSLDYCETEENLNLKRDNSQAGSGVIKSFFFYYF